MADVTYRKVAIGTLVDSLDKGGRNAKVDSYRFSNGRVFKEDARPTYTVPTVTPDTPQEYDYPAGG